MALPNPGGNIKLIRKNLGLTQTKFGKKFGLSYSAIANYENNVYPANVAMVIKLLRISKRMGLNFKYADLRID